MVHLFFGEYCCPDLTGGDKSSCASKILPNSQDSCYQCFPTLIGGNHVACRALIRWPKKNHPDKRKKIRNFLAWRSSFKLRSKELPRLRL